MRTPSDLPQWHDSEESRSKAKLDFWEGMLEKGSVFWFLFLGIFVFWCWVFKAVVL